jgi:hypothetical protein
MSEFKYQYDQLWGDVSQCELCHHDTCSDKGKRSMYDGKRHICSRFERYNKERREEIAKEEAARAYKEYLEHFNIGPLSW